MESQKVIFLAKYIDSGGVSAIMYSLGKIYKERGWKTTIICGGVKGSHLFTKEYYREAGIEFIELDYLRTGAKGFLKIPFIIKGFINTVKEIDPDIIHVHWRSVSLYAQLVKYFLNIPFVTTIHLNKIPSSFFYKVVSFWGNRVITISTETKEFMVDKFGLSDNRIEMIFNGADENIFYPPSLIEKQQARKRLKVEPYKFVISKLARLEGIKGHKTAIEAYDMLPEEIKNNSILLLGGEGSLKTDLTHYIENLGLRNNILLLGHINSQDLLFASDLGILTSYKEGFPVSVLEAMLCKVPFIRTRAEGAYDQIINGKTGYIIDFDDSNSLKERIIELYSDEEKRKEMAKNAYVFAKENFTINKVADKTLNLYKTVLSDEKK
ncbi:glycosyltransferase family 4 protein [Flagellimonas oceanensis]|uniref:glycosyltransferase family 4 protein n=1 Tax=Flagellimonas oceanensis TaxID=2499163 RepID=UPI000F8EA89E|nr:glycosyltransferase family 4 protein [Allomuricauda oceanensis]